MQDGVPATTALLETIYDVDVEIQTGVVYDTEYFGPRVRKIQNGVITTVAGQQGPFKSSGDDGPATAAMVSAPVGVAAGALPGTFYVGEIGDDRVRFVNSSGIITTVVGNGSKPIGSSTDNVDVSGIQGTLAVIYTPSLLKYDNFTGGLYISAYPGKVYVYNVTTGIVRTFAGQGEPLANSTGDGGPATAATLISPWGLAFDGQGSVFIADGSAHVVRKVFPNGTITTIAGQAGQYGYQGDGGAATLAMLGGLYGLAYDPVYMDLYIADGPNYVVRKVDATGVISTVAGGVSPGVNASEADNIPATSATLNPKGLAVDWTRRLLYIADRSQGKIRYIILSP
jgi:hypothetical protein